MDANNNHNGKTSDFPEAPASWNTRYITPEGFECQITLRGDSGTELLEKAALATVYLLKNDCIPYVYRPGYRPNGEAKNCTDQSTRNNSANGTNNTTSNPAWCPIHQCDMRRWDKNGRVWYSHKVDGKWCNGKEAGG
jgi:hypothetical protein